MADEAASNNLPANVEDKSNDVIIWNPNETLNDGKLYAIVMKYPTFDNVPDDPDPIELDLDAEEIDLNHSRVVTTENFDRLTKPTFLCLRNNFLKEIQCFGQMINLKELDLYDNQLTKIINLEQLVNLEYVHLD